MATLVKVSNPADPNRCQGIDGSGQCQYTRYENSIYCVRHGAMGGGSQSDGGIKKEAVKNFRLGRWQQRVGEFSENPQIKSLREEIGINRMMIEEILLKCTDNTELIIWSDKLGRLIERSQKLVESCHRIEERTGQLLDKQSILSIADILVSIIAEHIKDSDALDDVALRMVDAIMKVSNVGTHAPAIAG